MYCQSNLQSDEGLSCIAGVLSLQQGLKEQCTVRRMLREKLQAAQAAKLLAEKENALAAASAATYQHDLELLKHEVNFCVHLD